MESNKTNESIRSSRRKLTDASSAKFYIYEWPNEFDDLWPPAGSYFIRDLQLSTICICMHITHTCEG